MQNELLQEHPEKPIQVYAIWFNQLPGDSKGSWNAEILNDARVAEYWDSDGSVGRWFSERSDEMGIRVAGPTLWDASLLYGPDATWIDIPSSHDHFGRTIIAHREQLRRQLEAIWAEMPV